MVIDATCIRWDKLPPTQFMCTYKLHFNLLYTSEITLYMAYNYQNEKSQNNLNGNTEKQKK